MDSLPIIPTVRLTDIEARVVGSLAEKQATTPQQCPLTLNALVAACNQATNREPVVNYDPALVETAADELRQKGLLRLVYPRHGRSANRYRLVLDEALGLDDRQRALLAVLLLRGPQTLGELRTRTERLASFDDLAAVEAELAGLTDREEPLVRRLNRLPGQKEDRYAQTLIDESERAGQPSPGDRPQPPGVRSDAGPTPTVPTQPEAAGAGDPDSEPGPPRETPEEAIADLRGQLAELAATVATMRRDLDHLVARLGG
jgi:uncharacterized protein YceH (UPF0502 family)